MSAAIAVFSVIGGTLILAFGAGYIKDLIHKPELPEPVWYYPPLHPLPKDFHPPLTTYDVTEDNDSSGMKEKHFGVDPNTNVTYPTQEHKNPFGGYNSLSKKKKSKRKTLSKISRKIKSRRRKKKNSFSK